MTDIKIDVEGKLEKLIKAGLQAYDLLLEEVKRPVDPDLPDDKSRNAMKAKKECFIDCQDILLSIKELEVKIDEFRAEFDDGLINYNQFVSKATQSTIEAIADIEKLEKRVIE